jgi:murein hydrolase activator
LALDLTDRSSTTRRAAAFTRCRAVALGVTLIAAIWAPAAPAQNDDVEALRETRQAELEAVTRDIALTKERQADLQREIQSLDKDQATLNQTLIDAGRQVQRLEGKIDSTERRLRVLLGNEEAVRASLSKRRGVLAEVLAALQRMGHRPPPAMLVRPEDALASVRSAILLGAVVPDLRAAAEELAIDLRQLVTLREEREEELDRLKTDATALAEGRARVALLIEAKRNQRTASAQALADEERRAAILGEQATSLKDLIARLETESAAVAAAKQEADRAAAVARSESGGRPPASLGSPGRLAPKVAFSDAKGLLPMPVNGRILAEFGDTNEHGTQSLGVSVGTRTSAQVNSPADGWVVYAGPFRSYGQLLIINAGDGYHVLLAGMERIDVQLGQFVLAGEPVAVMPAQRLASVGAADIGASQPVLYIEFRKDGTSIDPAPWWAASNLEKVGG